MVPLGASHPAAEEIGLGPLSMSHERLADRLPVGSLLLNDAAAIEGFLERLDEEPPDWTAIYGDHGMGHDERLFALNRARDARRAGHEALRQAIAFVWPGELSDYDQEAGGFRVAIGPKLIPTRWGLVRFKPEGLSGNLVAVPPSGVRESFHVRATKGERIVVDVIMHGHLIPDESIIYDFSHEEDGRGIVMPVVLVEKVEYVLNEHS